MHIFLKLKSDWLGQTDRQTLTIFSAPILTDITLSFRKGNKCYFNEVLTRSLLTWAWQENDQGQQWLFVTELLWNILKHLPSSRLAAQNLIWKYILSGTIQFVMSSLTVTRINKHLNNWWESARKFARLLSMRVSKWFPSFSGWNSSYTKRQSMIHTWFHSIYSHIVIMICSKIKRTYYFSCTN